MSILETVTGHATFTNRRAKVQIFFVPTRDAGGSELPLGVTVVQNPTSGVRIHQRLGSTPAGQGMNPAVVGEFRLVNYEIPDGVLLKVFCDRNVMGARHIANQYIRMRVTAPFQQVKARLTDYPKAAMDRAVFRGRFDIISPDEARSLGARIPAGLEKFYTVQAVRSVFEYEVLAPATQEKTVMQIRRVENSAGEEVVIATAKSRRKLVVD